MDKKIYVFRNSTVEHLFKDFKEIKFSGYSDISNIEYAELYIWFYTIQITHSIKKLQLEIDNYTKKMEFILSGISPTKQIVLVTMNNINPNFNFLNDNKLLNLVNKYNEMLINKSELYRNIKVIDINEILNEFSKEDIIDYRHYYLSEIIISPKISSAFSSWIKYKIQSLYGKRKKCIILDLDNTLWGGVLGEDLISGIKLNEEYPGRCFLDFQELLLDATNYGVILAICSKNNLSDVEDLWERHPYVKLKKEIFSAIRINWNDKVSNIIEISQELNIGLDSFVFIDDNPRERELVKSMIPEVEVPEFPNKPYLLINFFWDIYNKYFQTFEITEEDTKKVNQYKENAVRFRTKLKYTALEDYIKDLNIKLKIMKANEFNISRIAQMTQKTNQFNLTTKRYTVEKLEEKIASGSYIGCVSVSDRFGDNGITVGIIIDFAETVAIIDSYFLSCRILGRNIEYVIMEYFLNMLYKKGFKCIRAKYIPTKRNNQTEYFFEKIGFELINQDNCGIKNYELKLNMMFKIEEYYSMEEK